MTVDVEIAEQHAQAPGHSGDDPRSSRSQRILRAIEAYKAACAAEGTKPTEEEAWLILLAAVNCPE